MLRLVAHVHLAVLGRNEFDRLLDRLRQRRHDLTGIRVRPQILDLVRDLPRDVVAQALELLAIRRAELRALSLEFLAACFERIAFFFDRRLPFFERGTLF